MSKRKKTSTPPDQQGALDLENESVTTRAVVPADVMKAAMGEPRDAMGTDPSLEGELPQPDEEAMAASVDVPIAIGELGDERSDVEFDAEMTVNLVGDLLPGRDDLDAPTVNAPAEALEEIDRLLLQRKHLRGLLEALVFASDAPIKPNQLAKLASAPQKQVKELLGELKVDYATRGIHLDEVAGGWVFRTSPQYAPFVRDLTKERPVRLTRAQVETLAIIAYRQPITRPEVDDVRGVDSGPVLKLLLERDLVRILGKRDEPGRPLIYGTTTQFLEFFGLKSLKDLPTLKEFTELSDESREAFEEELGETPEDAALRAAAEAAAETGAVEGGVTGETPAIAGDVDLEGDGDGDGDGDGGGESESDLDERDERRVRESMSVPVSEQPLDDLGDDDLEPIEATDPGVRDLEAHEHDVDIESGEVTQPPHASDDDGPTLTSEAPSADEE